MKKSCPDLPDPDPRSKVPFYIHAFCRKNDNREYFIVILGFSSIIDLLARCLIKASVFKATIYFQGERYCFLFLNAGKERDT